MQIYYWEFTDELQAKVMSKGTAQSDSLLSTE